MKAYSPYDISIVMGIAQLIQNVQGFGPIPPSRLTFNDPFNYELESYGSDSESIENSQEPERRDSIPTLLEEIPKAPTKSKVGRPKTEIKISSNELLEHLRLKFNQSLSKLNTESINHPRNRKDTV